MQFLPNTVLRAHLSELPSPELSAQTPPRKGFSWRAGHPGTCSFLVQAGEQLTAVDRDSGLWLLLLVKNEIVRSQTGHASALDLLPGFQVPHPTSSQYPRIRGANKPGLTLADSSLGGFSPTCVAFLLQQGKQKPCIGRPLLPPASIKHPTQSGRVFNLCGSVLGFGQTMGAHPSGFSTGFRRGFLPMASGDPYGGFNVEANLHPKNTLVKSQPPAPNSQPYPQYFAAPRGVCYQDFISSFLGGLVVRLAHPVMLIAYS